MKSSHPNLKLSSGFSLVELLAVIAIISVLTGAGVVALQSNTKATAISADTAKVFTAISEARQLAISSNARTRFVLFTDTPANPEDWRLRRYAILREVASTSSFELAHPAGDLSAGIYFQRGTGYGDGILASGNRGSAQMPGVAGAEYAYIEFLSSGATASSSAANIFQIGQGAAPDAAADTEQYAVIGVSQQTGRVRMERK